MNPLTAFSTWYKRPRAPHQPHPGLWVAGVLVVALLGTGAAFVRNLDDEPKIAIGTRVVGYLGTLITGAAPASPASGAATQVSPLLPRH